MAGQLSSLYRVDSLGADISDYDKVQAVVNLLDNDLPADILMKANRSFSV